MRKLLHILIGCSTLGILFVGCGEKLSPDAVYCQAVVDEMLKGPSRDKGLKDQLRKSCRAYDPPVSALDGSYSLKTLQFIEDSMEIICDDPGLSADDPYGHTARRECREAKFGK